jgi:integrase
MPRGAAVIEYRGARGVVYRIKYADADGKQVQETVGAERDGFTRKKAEAELRERLVRVERKHYRKPKPLTFSEWAATWLDEGQRKRAWKPNTRSAYENAVGYLTEYFGSTRLASIRPRDVSGYVSHSLKEPHKVLRRPISPKTLELHLSVLHDLFRTAVGEELLDSNPAAGVERPRVQRQRWRILEPDEVRRVAKAFTDNRASVVFLTLILTGVRRCELVSLRWGNVSLTEGRLRVAESKSDEGLRVIQMPEMLVTALADYYAVSNYGTDTDYVFAHPERGSRLDGDWYRGQFNDALAAAGIEGRVRAFHDMRHSALTNLALTSEANELVLMATAGHRSFATTKQYLHLAGRVFPDAAQALQDRLLGENFVPILYPSEAISDDLSQPNSALQARNDVP